MALGTGCNLISTIVVQFAFTVFSDVGVNVAGPDVNPAIFIATMASIARQAMIQNLEEANRKSATYTPTASPEVHHRILSGGGGHAPAPSPSGVELDPEKLLATVLALIMLSSCIWGVIMYILGRLKVSRGVQLVPGAVLAGFMACIGYLVILKALKTAMSHEVFDAGPFTWPFWMFTLPAIPIGVAMYLQKRLHIGSPVVVLPIILAIPLIIFFSVVYGTGSDIEQVREEGWLFPAFSTEVFYNQFIDSYGRVSSVGT